MDGVDDVRVPDDVEGPRQAARAERKRSMIEHGRRIGGTPGAIMAGAMIALQEIYEGPRTDEIVAIAETPDEPGDVDRDGMAMSVDGVDVAAPALPVTAPLLAARRRSRRRRRQRP